MLQWRNTELDFASIGALQASLAETPTEQGLTRAPIAEDILVLEHAARDDEVRALATTPDAVERLWEVCQVPDYRKIAPATHAELVDDPLWFPDARGQIPVDWFARQVAQADRTDGDIDTLSNRIAHVRTWTFVANRPDWLADPEHWQAVTRARRGQAVGCAARTTHRALRRPPHQRADAAAAREHDTGNRNQQDRRGRGRGPRASAGSTASRSRPTPRPRARRRRRLQAAAQKALAGEIDARADQARAGPRRAIRARHRRHDPLAGPAGRQARRRR